MTDYVTGEAGRKPVLDGDLRRRLMAKVGRPLTASAAGPGVEHVADDPFNSLVSGVYAAAAERS